MVTDRDCLSKGKKGKYRNLPTFANVNLIVLAQEEVKVKMKVETPTNAPPSRKEF
mgnify:CR=1 FL=1